MQNSLLNIKITDRQTFIQFLDILHKDLLNNPEQWENKTLPEFLEALISYAEDLQGYYDNVQQNLNADTPTWLVFADLLRGARIYE